MEQATTNATLEKIGGIIKELVGTEMKERLDEQASKQKEVGSQLAGIISAAAGGNGNQKKKGSDIGCLLHCLSKFGRDYTRAADYALDKYGNDTVSKALAAGEGVQGGFLVPEIMANEVIELLEPGSVVRQSSPTIVDMPNGSIDIPKLTGGATATYVGENADIPVTEQSFGTVRLTAKKLTAIVPMSNELVRYSSPNAEAIVRDDLVSSIAKREDIAFIRGDGTNDTPRGLLNFALTANKFNANGTPTLTTVTNELHQAVRLLMEANVGMRRPGWLFTPRTFTFLMSLRDGNGNFAFNEQLQQGRLLGWPFKITTQIPDNLGGGSNESEIYFVDFADALIGQSQQLILDVSQEAAYFDGQNTVSAFSKDQTVIRAITQHDFGMRHDESVVVIGAVTWGA